MKVLQESNPFDFTDQTIESYDMSWEIYHMEVLNERRNLPHHKALKLSVKT